MVLMVTQDDKVSDGVEENPTEDNEQVNGGDPLPEPPDDTPPIEDDIDELEDNLADQ